MKYIEHYKIKWHDTDASRTLQPSRLLAYMQETANLHLCSCGMSLDALRDERGLAFLLSRMSVRIYEPLSAYEEIDVETWVCESRGLGFQRCFRILRGDTVAAEAYSIWGLLDLNEKKLLPATAFPYQIEPDPPLDSALLARVRLPAAAQMEEAGERRIVYSDIDYNGHMNNTHYPNMLCDFTPNVEQKAVVGFTMSFLREAAYGHTLKILRAPRDDGYFFRTVDETGEVCLEAALMLTDAKNFHGISTETEG
ncbi:MAG: hypothetical protein IKJ35_00755 [Clostridia bacterium]|nr:hypothetical protein [Clostridia bacterium]